MNFDYIIIGAGSAGCILANRLSAKPSNRVLLVEAGPKDTNPWIHIPVGYAKTYYDPQVNWMYYTEADPGINHRQSYWPRGKVMGGSSSLNAMVFIRGQQADFNDWADTGAVGWGWADVLPYFKKLENVSFSSDSLRGKGGPVNISETRESAHPANEAFLSACEEAGFAKVDDFNGRTQEGVGYYQINTDRGRRASTAKAYLSPVKHRKNLTVVCNAQVAKLNFKGKRCVGVEYHLKGQKGGPVTAMAAAEVILSAGSVNSPQILECSGIGDHARLADIGVKTLHHLPSVGENLQDHIGVSYFYKSTVPTLNNEFTSIWGCLKIGLQYVITRKGPLSISVNHSGGFVKSSKSRQRPNIQLYFQPTSYMDAPSGTRPIIALDKFPAFNIGVSQCRPTSRGSIHIQSADITTSPVINPNYLSTHHDIEEAIESVKIIREIAASPSMKNIIVEEMTPGIGIQSDEELLEDYRNRCGTIFHPVSTCIMGSDPAKSVVSPDLKVHGIDRLRVVDASVFPTVTSGNTNAPTMMLAEKASDMILQGHS